MIVMDSELVALGPCFDISVQYILPCAFGVFDFVYVLSSTQVCGDVAGLCSWTRAMASFYSVNKEVLPLKANLAVQESRLEKAQGELAVAQAKLDEKEAELNAVRQMYENAMSEKQALQDDADSCKRRMEAATALIGGLSGEKERWTQQSKEFQEQLGRLVWL